MVQFVLSASLWCFLLYKPKLFLMDIVSQTLFLSFFLFFPVRFLSCSLGSLLCLITAVDYPVAGYILG